MSLKNRKLIVLFVLVLSLIGAVLVFINRQSSGTLIGMREVKSYDANGRCLAANYPPCGYCPNEPVNEKCYVKKGELEDYR